MKRMFFLGLLGLMSFPVMWAQTPATRGFSSISVSYRPFSQPGLDDISGTRAGLYSWPFLLRYTYHGAGRHWVGVSLGMATDRVLVLPDVANGRLTLANSAFLHQLRAEYRWALLRTESAWQPSLGLGVSGLVTRFQEMVPAPTAVSTTLQALAGCQYRLGKHLFLEAEIPVTVVSQTFLSWTNSSQFGNQTQARSRFGGVEMDLTQGQVWPLVGVGYRW